jgi:isopentenyldiphosphate isomerase
MEEVFDIVDEKDRIIGTALRSEVHGNPGLIHRVAHVLVFNSEGALFLQKRSMSKDVQPGKWDTSVGGHLDSGESYERAVLREMGEELGIEDRELTFLHKYLHVNEVEAEYVSTYVCTFDGPIHIQEKEIDDGRFFKLEEIACSRESGNFTPNCLHELELYKNRPALCR